MQSVLVLFLALSLLLVSISLDVSAGGFRVRHTHAGLATGCEVRFSYGANAGTARVVWTRHLGEEIDAQLRVWSLTPAEREITLLLLKGYGHKEIAVLLERSERTVRQHAVAVYRKSGLSGRAELSAFFLEDLLLPPEPPA